MALLIGKVTDARLSRKSRWKIISFFACLFVGVCFSSYFSDFRHAIEPVVRGAVFKPCLACPEKRSRHVHPALFINHLKTDKFTERHKS